MYIFLLNSPNLNSRLKFLHKIFFISHFPPLSVFVLTQKSLE